MPSLHKSVAYSHYYIRTMFQGRRMTIQLTSEGVQHLTITLGLRDGDGFGSAVIETLYEKRWAFTLGGGLGEEVDRLGDREVDKVGIPPAETVQLGVTPQHHGRRDRPAMSIRMESHDHATLDRSVKDIIEAARLAGAILHGPIPLPTRVEKYTVVRARSGRLRHNGQSGTMLGLISWTGR